MGVICLVAKIFAEGRERNEQGWLIYPRDKPLRASMYPEELLAKIMTHPAKQQAYLCRDIVEFVSEPGDTILDCFGGVGTTLIAAAMGRNVNLIEIEDYYAGIINQCISHLRRSSPVVDGVELNDRNSILGNMMLIQADNRLAMPIPCDHIITSPPYGNDLYQGAGGESEGVSTKKLATKGDKTVAELRAKEMAQYGQAHQNLGKLNPFVYKQSMNKVYALMVKSVKVGGTITITHRDRMKDGERVLYIDSIIGTLVGLGCGVYNLDKWETPRTIQASVNINLGAEVVLDEDIITMRKPE